MARVTVEDCLEKVNKRIALVIRGAERARQLANRGRALVRCDNKPAVTALREIAERTGSPSTSRSRATVNEYLVEKKAHIETKKRKRGVN